MKVLFIYCNEFGYKTSIKTLTNFPDKEESKTFNDTQVAFIHVEEKDMEQKNSILKRLINSIKWICRKNNTQNIILHSFAHLSESKAEPEFTYNFLNEVEAKLINSGYNVHQTPFGYFLDLNIKAPGFSLARVFQEF
jgi:hypothetical protein